jgi:hypothetical protein
MGMILDSIACLKTAFEALQYVRLISLDPKFAASFIDARKIASSGRGTKATGKNGARCRAGKSEIFNVE